MTGLRRASRMAAAAVALAVTVSGCAGARNALGTGSSVCFKALPAANAAVHAKSHLVGVRRVPASTMQRRFPQNAQLGAIPPGSHLCVFAFGGSFRGTDVDLVPPAASGGYAVVAVAGTRPKVVAAYVLARLPTRFRHTRA
jgi:hypothetical protein